VELIILAILAVVVLYQLYAVLGRRMGRQPGDAKPAPARPAAREPLRPAEEPKPRLEAEGLAALRTRDPRFDPEHFLQGARSAYETIVRGFAAGDREALRRLVAPEAMTAFEQGIDAREAEGRSEAVEFQHAPRADLDKVELNGDRARVRTRFLAEFRSRTKGPEGEAVDDRRTAELWTFERDLTSPDPNWTLVRVEAAEA
jgi:predicted lipid-binding transport protein (Tim44 family)